MTAVTEASTARQRTTARREALHLITIVWEHREKLVGRAYPLAPLRQILDVISLFTEDESRPWWGYHQKDATEAMLFRAFTKLMPCLLLLHGPDVDRVPRPGDAPYEYLEQDERAILEAVRDWLSWRTPARPDGMSQPRDVVVRADDERNHEGRIAESEGEDQECHDSKAALRTATLEAISLLERGLLEVRARLEGSEAVSSEDAADDDRDQV